ncbi:MAG: dienelactone hydrolase family protein [Gammaproteobacteria bacterium]|nr:dienelactone hydrolase family protein [Gammaproteobacteria bacterium]
MAIQTRLVEYHDGNTLLEGYMAWDDTGGARPGILISHAWGGRDGFVEEKARELAAEGYTAFALDMYGKGVRGNTREECAALMTKLTDDRAGLQKRINAALTTLAGQPEVDAQRIAAIGFCFGGLCVLDLARRGAELRSVISFHGLLGAPGNTGGRSIKAAVLVLNGHDDPMVSAADIAALQEDLTRAGCDWQFHNYGRTMHAFTNPVANDPDFGTVFNATTNRRAWQTARNFLAETLN